MRRKLGDIGLLLSGLTLALCLQYLSPSIRSFSNILFFGKATLRQKLQDICVGFSESVNNDAVLTVTIIAVVVVVIIVVLIVRRRDYDVDILEELRSVRKILEKQFGNNDNRGDVGYAEETTTTKSQTTETKAKNKDKESG